MKAFARLAAVLACAAGLQLSVVAQTPGAPPEEPAAAAHGVPADDQAAAAQAVAAQPSASGPARVKIGAYINDIQSLDLRTHSFVADIYIWFRDSDPEIVPGSTFEWMNMFAPDDHVQTALYETPQPQPDGSQYELFRHQGPFAAKFSVRTYPFDSHELTIQIEDQEFTANRLIYEIDEIAMNNIEIPGFIIGKPELRIENQPYATAFGDLANPEAAPYSRVSIVLPIHRPMLSGVVKALLPVFIVVLVAAASLLLSPSHVEARVGLSITALLTLVALQFSAGASLPEVGYLLMLDQIYLASYAFILLVIALLVQSTGKGDAALAEGVDHGLRAGWLPAFLATAFYGGVVAVILFINLSGLLPSV